MTLYSKLGLLCAVFLIIFFTHIYTAHTITLLDVLKKNISQQSPHIILSSLTPNQGETLLVRFDDTVRINHIAKVTLTFNEKSTPLRVITIHKRPAILIPFDLNETPGTRILHATFWNRKETHVSFTLAARYKPVYHFNIPTTLGGNTVQAKNTLITTLAKDNLLLSTLPSNPSPYWKDAFRYPTDVPIITDTFGYGRNIVGQVLSHKGVDFRARIGTPIVSIHHGTVIYTGTFRNYGTTVVVDHGGGVQSLYLHLSSIKTPVHTKVKKGDVIGFSGNTGYSFAPHLHLSIKVRGLSIDPIQFIHLWKYLD
ncbi:MAG: M23 family metallopeptidase [Alphaproteobacteria bacterium]|nr:M23 family metallopeptidase [Alphaproteobacteria bacterium]